MIDDYEDDDDHHHDDDDDDDDDGEHPSLRPTIPTSIPVEISRTKS